MLNRNLAPPLLALACAVLSTVHAQENDPNVCDTPGEAPDVVVGAIEGSIRWGAVDDITAFSVGTWSCNIGTCELQWDGDTNAHPVIGQGMYRLRDGRFEQIGQSWLKHGFFALSLELCNTGCIATDGSTLGVRCADPYSAGLNGEQSGLGPKFEINASTGEYPFPFSDSGLVGDAIYKRLQVHDTDLDPLNNAGASYFVEGQYVTRDDAEAGNHANNASYRPIDIVSQSGLYDIILAGETVREQPAIMAWVADDDTVLIDTVDVTRDGRFIVGSKATEVAAGLWLYEYAIQNLMSHRGLGTLRVPVPVGATIGASGFHDVDYHSGEPFDGTDWTAEIVDDPTGRWVQWSTDAFADNPNANALRWGTLYNFRFTTDVGPAPSPGTAVLTLFLPGFPDDATTQLIVPGPCNADGVCNAEEDCDSCPQDCLGPAPTEYCCGDGVCDPGEDECSCTSDCGTCLVPCNVLADCDDGLTCNGSEDCVDGFCAAGAPPCGDLVCDEDTGTCLECVFSDSCNDGVFCTGVESCADNACAPGADPCPGLICVEERGACAECLDNTDCDDRDFCNGVETCFDDACADGIPPCAQGEMCDEEADICLGCRLDRCKDGSFCNGVETCLEDRCEPGTPPCTDLICDELHDRCVTVDALQPRPGDPVDGLTPELLERFGAGRDAFEHAFASADGLGPVYNASACADCHLTSDGGTGTATVTRFGFDDGNAFDPLTALGGSLLQTQAIRPECAETMPGQSNVSGERIASTPFGAGLVEALAEADLLANATNPPAGLSGRTHQVPLLEELGTVRIGRYGWKSQQGSVLSSVAEQTIDHLGLTNRVIGTDHAPNGDMALLAECDAVNDPEDVPDAFGVEFIDRATDYLRYLAPPPQTPTFGMRGELLFVTTGCAGCHKTQYVTPAAAGPEGLLGDRTVKPYSDYLLHDMGTNGEPSAQGDALPGEVRTAPLWGLLLRDRLWHDGRFADSVFEDRVRAAIAAHDAPGSDAAAIALAFAGLSTTVQNRIVTFLGSLGRAEFDADGDGVVGGADHADFLACFTGPGSFYDADALCAVHDADADGDVDDDDYVLFIAGFDGRFGGTVPDGDTVPGEPLMIGRSGNELLLTWSGSCLAADTDYAVYQGSIGDWDSHFRRSCSTGGNTTTTLLAPSSSVYYLVVPHNGLSEGSYGVDAHGVQRPPAGGSLACLPQWRADSCD